MIFITPRRPNRTKGTSTQYLESIVPGLEAILEAIS
jgi:hypothetical protein